MRARFLLVGLLALPAAAGDAVEEFRGRVLQAKDRVYPALVHIVNVEEFFLQGRRQRTVSSGSGFLVDDAGHIVTNYHVAGKAAQLFVTLCNRRKVKAEPVAGDPYTDLAVIRVDPKEAFPEGRLPFALLGDSDRLAEGDFVMAMGSPLSLSRTVSFGIVSCRDRNLDPGLVEGQETGRYNTWIQTDAAINPGNSGGPLVNLDGEIVGVNTRASLGFNNIGFAIPSNVVKEVVAQLIAGGEVVRATLGITLQPLDEIENTDFAASGDGLLVATVEAGSPAAKAGVRPGDFLLALGGTPIRARFREELPAVYRAIASLPIGVPVRLALRRTAGPETGPLEVEAAPERLGVRLGREAEISGWGITVQAVTERLAREAGLPDATGVIVTGVRAGSPAAGRLDRGDVVRILDGKPVADLETFQRLAGELIAQKAPRIRIAFWSGGGLDVTVLRAADGETER